MSSRNVVFVSHANPEDNGFARWLTLKLISAGYRAWCDGTNLWGGEDFWKDVERVIRESTARFLFVVSKSSNQKNGPLMELKVAAATATKESLSNFIVPIRIDDLDYQDMNIELSRLAAIDFSESWATGLKQVLRMLQQNGVPTDGSATTELVRQWWETTFDSARGVTDGTEVHFSNWFPVELPRIIYRHTLLGLIEGEPAWNFPTRITTAGLFTFADRKEVEPGLGTLLVKESEAIETSRFLNGEHTSMSKRDRRNLVVEFLSSAWSAYAQLRGLQPYSMATRRTAFCFDRKNLPNPNVSFTSVTGSRTYRGLVGIKTLPGERQRHWHFAVSAEPMIHPRTIIRLRYHVLFSDDGLTLWESPDRMHRARRSQCKSWWNDDWRDRLLATANWLSNDTDTFHLALSPSQKASVSARPVEFVSPVTLIEPLSASAAAALAEGDEDDDDDDDLSEIPDGSENGPVE